MVIQKYHNSELYNVADMQITAGSIQSELHGAGSLSWAVLCVAWFFLISDLAKLFQLLLIWSDFPWSIPACPLPKR